MKKTLLGICLFLSLIGKSQTTNDPEWMKQMGSRTAKQTWWFFDKRLKEPLDYTFQHVYIEFINVYIKDIKQLPSGKYQGLVDLDLPHDPSFDEQNQEIKFDSAEIDDWFMVNDKYLVGGFVLRLMAFNDLKPIKRKGDFNIPFQSINEDFIESSEIPDRLNFSKDYFDIQKAFPGGRQGLQDSIHAHLNYTEYAHMMGIEGFVTVQFTIDRYGVFTDLKVIRGVGAGLNDSAKRAFREISSYWKPRNEGDNGSSPAYFTYSIRFRFTDYEQTFR